MCKHKHDIRPPVEEMCKKGAHSIMHMNTLGALPGPCHIKSIQELRVFHPNPHYKCCPELRLNTHTNTCILLYTV